MRIPSDRHTKKLALGAALLNANKGFCVKVKSVETVFGGMADELKLPRGGETGVKLIRRSMATIARLKLGEDRWAQGQRMLGHNNTHMSDIYAVKAPSQLGMALAVTDEIIEEIVELAPGSFDPVP